MLWLVFVGCVLASAFNAASSLLEREAARKPDMHKLFSRKLAVEVAKNEKFIIGIVFQLIATALTIMAIGQGSLVLIGPLLTLDLVFLWLFISWRYQVIIRPKNWFAIACIICGLSLLSICTRISSDSSTYQPLAWLIGIGTVLLVIAVAIAITRYVESPLLKAGVMGFATACNYAIDAGLIKLLIGRLRDGGVHEVIFGWPLYTVIALAILSLWMMQNTFSAGPLTISQPIIEIIQAAATAAIGIFVFNDDVAHSWLTLIGDGASVVLIVAGIYILATNKDLFQAVT